MKQPTKKELVKMLEKCQAKFNEHQKVDDKILAGYTLAANVKGLTKLSNEITTLLVRIKL